MTGKKISLHVYVDRDMYEKLWRITKRRFLAPSKKLSTIIREALEQYIERNLQE